MSRYLSRTSPNCSRQKAIKLVCKPVSIPQQILSNKRTNQIHITMRFTLTSLFVPFILVGHAVLASPIDDRSPSDIDARAEVVRPSVVPISVAPVAHPDVTLPKFKIPPGASTTSPNTGLHSLSVSLADSVVLCAPHDCTSCVGYALSSLSTGLCYSPPSAWFSGYLYIASGISPGYNLYTSTTTATYCGSAQLMPINVCTNVVPNGISGFDFFLL